MERRTLSVDRISSSKLRHQVETRVVKNMVKNISTKVYRQVYSQLLSQTRRRVILSIVTFEDEDH